MTTLDRLNPFVGTWEVEAIFPEGGPAGPAGRATFEWTLDGAFLLQQITVPIPEAPDSLALIGADGDGYTQHYFDSRGVVRTYAMDFRDSVWTLTRDHPGFSQRFTATFSDDRNTIAGAWQKSTDGSTWEHDFDMTYTRVA